MGQNATPCVFDALYLTRFCEPQSETCMRQASFSAKSFDRKSYSITRKKHQQCCYRYSNECHLLNGFVKQHVIDMHYEQNRCYNWVLSDTSLERLGFRIIPIDSDFDVTPSKETGYPIFFQKSIRWQSGFEKSSLRQTLLITNPNKKLLGLVIRRVWRLLTEFALPIV